MSLTASRSATDGAPIVRVQGRAPGLEHAHLDPASGAAGDWRACWWRGTGAVLRTASAGAGRGVRLVVAEPEAPLPREVREELLLRLDLALARLGREGTALPDVVEELVRIPVAGSVRGRLGCLVALDLRPDGRVDACARCAPGPLRLFADGTAQPVCSPVGSAALTLGPGEALVVTTPSALDGPDRFGAADAAGQHAAPLRGAAPGTGPCELLDRLAVGAPGLAPLAVGAAAPWPSAPGSAVLAVMRAHHGS